MWLPGPAWAVLSEVRSPPDGCRDELQTFITTLNWDELFGASTFAYKNIRRKTDARAYPSRLEFGLKGGIVPPTALNSGQDVELLLGRIAAPYFDIQDFDVLPTPFRTVAVDLLSAQPVVIRRGSLADAMRATMSLPLIFPPTEVDGQVLIDDGTMNNVPADIVKAMGADRVIAINVGDLSDPDGVSYTMLGVAGSTLDAMMRASTRRALPSGGRSHQRAARKAMDCSIGGGPPLSLMKATVRPTPCAISCCHSPSAKQSSMRGAAGARPAA